MKPEQDNLGPSVPRAPWQPWHLQSMLSTLPRVSCETHPAVLPSPTLQTKLAAEPSELEVQDPVLVRETWAVLPAVPSELGVQGSASVRETRAALPVVLPAGEVAHQGVEGGRRTPSVVRESQGMPSEAEETQDLKQFAGVNCALPGPVGCAEAARDPLRTGWGSGGSWGCLRLGRGCEGCLGH